MGRNVALATILLFLIIAQDSNADFLWNFRKLAASSPNQPPNGTVSPMASPVFEGKNSGPPEVKDKTKEKQNQPITPPSNSTEDKPKESPAAKNKVLPPPNEAKEGGSNPKEEVREKDEEAKEKSEEAKERAEEKSEEVKEKSKSKPVLPAETKESCDGIDRKCRDAKSMVACIKSFGDASKPLVLLIQNTGEDNLKVDLRSPPVDKLKVINIPKFQSEKVNLSLPVVGSNEIRLNAGSGDCVIPVGAPASQGNFFQQFQQLPSYSKFMTPIYGVYLLLATTLIAGGICACCWFRKRKRENEIPYQELEMSVPETAAAAVSAEGWDQDWDDDWDEENAVKSPGGHNISANGLTSRAPKKDGWEDWDD